MTSKWRYCHKSITPVAFDLEANLLAEEGWELFYIIFDKNDYSGITWQTVWKRLYNA